MDLQSPVPVPDDVVDEAAPAEAPSKPRSRRLAIVLLSVILALTLGALAFVIVQYVDATSRISDQQRQLDEQRDLINQKETFGAAMASLLDSAGAFEGTLMSSLVPFGQYENTARLAWSHRWTPAALDKDIATIVAATEDLDKLRSDAATESGANSTETTYEAVIDDLGGGFVRSIIDDADTLCEADVLACVLYEDPLAVHFDAADATQPYMTDWIRTGIAYHEFAHVLQMTNPVPTDAALGAFGGDAETMADCFALTYLSGWTLDHRVYVSSYEYWDVSIGYGYTCDESQAQAVRDWYGQLGVQLRPLSQER